MWQAGQASPWKDDPGIRLRRFLVPRGVRGPTYGELQRVQESQYAPHLGGLGAISSEQNWGSTLAGVSSGRSDLRGEGHPFGLHHGFNWYSPRSVPEDVLESLGSQDAFAPPQKAIRIRSAHQLFNFGL